MRKDRDAGSVSGMTGRRKTAKMVTDGLSGMTGRRKTAKMVTDGLLTSVPVFQDRDFLENHDSESSSE